MKAAGLRQLVGQVAVSLAILAVVALLDRFGVLPRLYAEGPITPWQGVTGTLLVAASLGWVLLTGNAPRKTAVVGQQPREVEDLS